MTCGTLSVSLNRMHPRMMLMHFPTLLQTTTVVGAKYLYKAEVPRPSPQPNILERATCPQISLRSSSSWKAPTSPLTPMRARTTGKLSRLRMTATPALVCSESTVATFSMNICRTHELIWRVAKKYPIGLKLTSAPT